MTAPLTRLDGDNLSVIHPESLAPPGPAINDRSSPVCPPIMPREQSQFLEVVGRDEAARRWREVVKPVRLGSEDVRIAEAFGRILADDVWSSVDVPAFDRSNLDGYAVRGQDTFGASETEPVRLRLNAEELATGVVPRLLVEAGTATPIATGGMLPRGADAILMVEHANLDIEEISIRRPVVPGGGVSFAGTDIARGELVLRAGTSLTARETGVLAAIGQAAVGVVRRPRVAILSTGDEILEPGDSPKPGSVYDANATILADSVRELGGEPVRLGIVPDHESAMESAIDRAIGLGVDLIVLSGGTSKGAGDVSYRILALRMPGVVVHGVALKPGKPVCLGAIGGIPVAILPGFPTSATFTFHEFVAPLIRELGGRRADRLDLINAHVPARINGERGRTEYVLVNLIDGPGGLAAYLIGKGSGSVTAFGRADGFATIPEGVEYLEAGESVRVTPIGIGRRAADLVVVGSHCPGLDALLGMLAAEGFEPKTLWVGSEGGIAASGRGECDLAGVHLFDPESDSYNRPFLPSGVRLLRGYRRMQGFVYRPGDERFEGRTIPGAIRTAIDDPGCILANRNRGSGTRVLLDGLLRGARPMGYPAESRSHNGVAAAVAGGRADWGLAIGPVAALYGLGFIPLRAEEFDFAVPIDRLDRPAVSAFRRLLGSEAGRERLRALGFEPSEENLE